MIEGAIGRKWARLIFWLRINCIFFICICLAFTVEALGQGAPANPPQANSADVLGASLLQDSNLDGVVTIVAFGDSITRGVGDFIPPGIDVDELTVPDGEAGFPLRIEQLLGVGVENRGFPGELITEEGIPRFCRNVQRLRPDLVIIQGGSNDARIPVSAENYFSKIQLMINVARSVGSTPILTSLVPPCCDHLLITPVIPRYNQVIHELAQANQIPLADVDHAFRNTCDNINRCHLLNLPDGLHPNKAGYDIIGEVMAAALLQINIFSPTGPGTLEQALGVPAGTIETVPDLASPAT